MKHATRLPRWRRLLLILCLAGFLVFLLPVFRGILDLSNLSAMAFFLTAGLVLLRWEGFCRLLRRLWGRRWGRALVLTVGIGGAGLLLLLLGLMIPVLCHMRDRPREECPTLVVLGCQVHGESPSLLLLQRINAAEDYLREHPAAEAVLSGSRGPGEDISEAECMFRILTARGIDPARLHREDQSHNTLENLRFSQALMEREGLEGPAVLVSNNFHIYRAQRMAADLGFPVRALAAEAAWYSVPTYVLREAMALIKYRLTA